jgi:uncharacterized membrane protein
MEVLQSLLRWAHIVAGIAWIGHLYFFNFVNAPLGTVLDGPTKQKVVPELMPRALYWFRWGAAWTWITGVLLLMIVFWHGGLMFEPGRGSLVGGILMVMVTFLAAWLYDVLAKTTFGKDLMKLAGLGLAAIIFIVVGYREVGFTYRAYVIHTGAMFGTIMAYNVWMRIWPAQRQIISAVKGGTPADANLVAMAGARSRHNTYLSVPLIWAMINSHTATPFANSWLWLIVMIVVGWSATYWLYSKAGQVKGF